MGYWRGNNEGGQGWLAVCNKRFIENELGKIGKEGNAISLLGSILEFENNRER